MRVLVKHRGLYPEIEEVEGTDALKALQKLVGGNIEIVPITEKIQLVVDEEGKLKGKLPNIVLIADGKVYDVCVGTVAAIGVTSDGEFRELTRSERIFAANWLDVRSIKIKEQKQ